MKSPSSEPTPRRLFLGSLGKMLAAATAPCFVPSSVLGLGNRPAPSERIAMGFIGLGGQGDRDLRAFLGRPAVQVVALCDVDSGSDRYERQWIRGLAPALSVVEERYGEEKRSGRHKGCLTFADFREVVHRSDIDAVSIATPDHWHAIPTIMAAKAGKDVFCQKPLSLTVQEGRSMERAIRRYGRVFQCGTQRRSSAQCRHSCELVRNGRIGEVHTVRVGLPGGHTRVRAPVQERAMPAPEGFDYDLWLGQAPAAPYHLERCHFTFRWNYDYSGGQVTDWGAHFIDMAHWGMDKDNTGPVQIEGSAAYPKDQFLWDTAESFDFECLYGDGQRMIASNRFPMGVRFMGTEGWVDLEGDTEPKDLRASKIKPEETHLYACASQYDNFLDCVKTRQETSASVEVAHRSVSVAHLANIAVKLGRPLTWNPGKERFEGDEEANRSLSRPMRSPWSL